MAQIGDYELTDKIGEGGMAMVYKATQISLQRPVALKVLSRALTDDEEIVERFNRESLIISRLKHPNIIRVIDRGIADSVPYFAMELVEGTDLARVIADGSYDFNQKLDVTVQLCKALAYAHRNGVIHLDIKPANILIDTDGNVLVSDFGISKLFDSEECADNEVTMGTPSYMSPEQKSGEGDVTIVSDIYSLGVVMYELFTGRKPVVGVLPSAINPAISRQMNEIIVGCLRKNPGDRIQSADAVKNALLASLQGSHIRKEKRDSAIEGFQNLKDKFRLLDVIREHAHGAVYLFENRASMQPMVIKKIPGRYSGISEARKLSTIKHTNIADIYGTSSNGRVSIIVMEYLPGGSLEDRMANIPSWSDELPTMLQICDALGFLHNNQIIHGNLRPSNILFTEDGRAKVSDVGLNEHYGDDPESINWYSIPGEARSVKTDIFATGMMFSELLTGELPTERKGEFVQDYTARWQPQELRRIIAKMIARNPAERYRNFTEIQSELEVLQEQARQETTRTQVQSRSKTSFSNRLGLAGLASSVGAFVKSAFR